MAPQLFARSYADLFEGSAEWRALKFPRGPHFEWDPASTFIRRPRTFANMVIARSSARDLHDARILAMYGDMVTTEHLSPMATIPEGTPAARYLESLGVAPYDFVSYAARRLNDDVMMRGALASPHLVNELAPDLPGGMTRHVPSGAVTTIFDAAERYRAEGIPLILVGGRSFGAGSSRDWSAKGPATLGVKVIIAESFERIYRSNLVAAGVLPLQFTPGTSRKSLGLDGAESVAIEGLETVAPGATVTALFTRPGREPLRTALVACIETDDEAEHIHCGGLLPALLRRLVNTSERK